MDGSVLAKGSAAKLISVPRMADDVPDEKKKRILQTHLQFTDQLWSIAQEKLMDVVQDSHPLRVEQCAHLIDRFVRKRRVTEQMWESILARCDIDASVCRSEDGTYNVLALDDEALLRLYVETPLHHAALLL